MVQKFWPDYGLLLELHTLTLVACSYVLLKWYIHVLICSEHLAALMLEIRCYEVKREESAKAGSRRILICSCIKFLWVLCVTLVHVSLVSAYTLVFTLGVVPVSQPQELSQWCSHLLYTQPGCIMWRQLVRRTFIRTCTCMHTYSYPSKAYWLQPSLAQ